MALPDGGRNDPSLRPVLTPDGLKGWTTESEGVKRQFDATGKYQGYAGEKPVQPELSPVDLVGPVAARGLWMLGGRGLKLAAESWPIQPLLRAHRRWRKGEKLQTPSPGNCVMNSPAKGWVRNKAGSRHRSL
jgi:hypothetical protein